MLVRLSTLCFVLATSAMAVVPQCGAATIYDADFSLADKGAWGNSNDGVSQDVTGVNWTVDVSNSGIASDSSTNDFRTKGGVFTIQDIGGIAVWSADPIDVSLVSSVALMSDVAVTGLGANSAAEFLRFYYQLDGADAVETDFSSGGSLSLPIDVSSGSALVVGFSANVNGTGDGWEISNLTVDAVPEPTSWAVAVLACLVLTGVHRRRIAGRRP